MIVLHDILSALGVFFLNSNNSLHNKVNINRRVNQLYMILAKSRGKQKHLISKEIDFLDSLLAQGIHTSSQEEIDRFLNS